MISLADTMTDDERKQKIDELYRGFELKLEARLREVQLIVRDTLRQVEELRLNDIRNSLTKSQNQQ